MVTLIFISGPFHLPKKRNQVLFFGKELISCLSQVKVRAFNENRDRIYTERTFINPLSTYHKKLYGCVIC